MKKKSVTKKRRRSKQNLEKRMAEATVYTIYAKKVKELRQMIKKAHANETFADRDEDELYWHDIEAGLLSALHLLLYDEKKFTCCCSKKERILKIQLKNVHHGIKK